VAGRGYSPRDAWRLLRVVCCSLGISTRTTSSKWRHSRRCARGIWESVPIGTFSGTSSSLRACTTWKTSFGNGRRSPLVTGSVTNKPRKVTGRCPLLITHIRNGHKITTVTTTSHRSRENDCFSGPTGNFGNGHQNKARYCEINIRDVCGEPTSLMS
jgi:hypothetical protein